MIYKMTHTFNNLESAINTIIESSKKHASATDSGDYKTANKNYAIIKKAVTYLRENDGIEKLEELLLHADVSVRIWAASYLLRDSEKQAIPILEEIESKSIPHHSFAARLVLQGWKKGTLNL
jgi:hypothetical protein